MQRRRVILYGNSVLLGAIGAILEHYSELELVPLAAPLPSAGELGALTPDVIFFDSGSAPADLQALFTLLQECPSLLLVGANPENAPLMLWSSGRCDAVTAADLRQVIFHGLHVQKGGHDRDESNERS